MFFPLSILIAPRPDEPLQSLQDAYHFKLEEISQPLEWHGDHYVVVGKPASAEKLRSYEPVFAKEWSLYPPSYVIKAEVHRIVFAAGLAVDGQVRAAVPAFDGDTMYYDPELGSYNLHYQRTVIHHEFFHLVDQRMGHMAKDAEWSKLNPVGFHYGSGGAKMRTKGVGELTDTIPGFLTPYGTSAVEEDKAELFAHMIVDGPYVKERASKDSVLAAKVDLLRKRLRDFDTEMDTRFWSHIPGWDAPAGPTLSWRPP